jgi:response regulator RpfG family c-di-GMP phosphodiesterase
MNDANAVTDVVAELPMTVLCVDDESDILQSMQRLLRKKNYHLLLATSGEKALELMQQNDVHLVISDMRMPSMSGVELLEKIATSFPNTYRILLTGYADMESTVNAVNKGKIHRYLQKPWDNEELMTGIEEGVEKVRLKYENINLQKLIKKQNISLKELNQNLEDKVKLRTKQIHSALNRIERNNNATQKVLYNLININPHLNGGFANSVSQLSKRIAEHLSLSKEEIRDVTYAALLCEIGLLGLDTSIYSEPFSKLNFNQQQEYVEQTKIAQLVLGPAVHLQTVSDIITCQFEWHNGTGPNKLVDSQIPMGARVLSVARDYWRYVLGRMTPDTMNQIEVQKEMKKFTGTRYDPAVLEILFNTDDIVSDEFIEKPIPTLLIEPGMVLKYNLFNNAHILVLPEGHVFSTTTIARLIQFEKSQPEPMFLIVEDQQAEA